MKAVGLALGGMLLISCSDDSGPTEPTGAACDEVFSVTTTVSGTAPVFEWKPGCPIAGMSVVGYDNVTHWTFLTTDFDETSTTTANVVSGPVTFGTLPAGAEELSPVVPLVAGENYKVYVYRVVPEERPCGVRETENLCLVNIKHFTK